nr:MAG TPA: hypothetical protein [Caudoviricetes sp.]
MKKIKEILFTDEASVPEDEFATKREKIYFIAMITVLLITLWLVLFLAISMAVNEKLVDIVTSDKKEINTLLEDRDYYYDESLRYKMMYEDLYEMYVYPQIQEEEGVLND